MKGLVCHVNISALYWKNPKPKPVTNYSKNQSQSSNTDNNFEIRVCTNKPCKRQGSMDILQTLSGISTPTVSVTASGCLGSCGAGPNIVVLPGPVFVKYCATPARAARTMFEQVVGKSEGGVDAEDWIKNSLLALALRKRAEDEVAKGGDRSSVAEQLLSEAINLKPCGGVHHLYKARSAARLMMGMITEALDDALEAITQAPNDPQAYICQADALMAIDQHDEAEKSYAMAAELDPSVLRSKSFKVRIAKLQEKLVAADLQ